MKSMSKKNIRSVSTERIEWIHVTSTQKDVVGRLRKRFSFHPLDLRDIEPPIQRPKAVVRDGYLFMILLYPVFDKKTREINVSEVDFFISGDRIVTVNTDALGPLEHLFNSCTKRSTEKKHVCLSGDVSQLLYAILNDLLSSVFPKIVNMQADMDALETKLKDMTNKKLISDILRIKLNVMNARQAMQGHKNVMPKLLEMAPAYFQFGKLKIYYEELMRDAYEIWDALELQKETIEAIHETNKSLIDHRTNEIIKTLTIFSVIVFPLTLLAAMFGMNVPVPFEEHPNGFWLITGIMLGGSFGMLFYFKHKKWI
jgi:magnesium transporter